MKKYFLLVAASVIVMSMAFVQCKRPVTTGEKLKTQIENTISVDASESKKIINSSELTGIEKSITTIGNKLKPIVVDKSKPITSNTPKPIVVKLMPSINYKPEATTVIKYTALMSADFSLKICEGNNLGNFHIA